MHWQEFFRFEADQYDTECFTQATETEVAFLLEELALPKGAALLDVGCGTGRHSVRLAATGLDVTGIDLSEHMLAKARGKAEAQGLAIDFQQCNAADLDFDSRFDAAICLCEGALCLLGQDDDPLARDLTILKNIHRALKPGGRFLTTVLNAFRMARAKGTLPEADTYDPMTQTWICEITLETPEGPKTFPTRERHYTPTEFALMLRVAGFEIEHLWGSTAGNWRKGPLDLDEYEFMAIARKGEL